MDDAPAMGDGEKNVVILSSDMLGGIQAMPGASITFTVTKKPDSQGNVAGYFTAAGQGQEMPEEEESWEDGLRRAVSPRSMGENAQ